MKIVIQCALRSHIIGTIYPLTHKLDNWLCISWYNSKCTYGWLVHKKCHFIDISKADTSKLAPWQKAYADLYGKRRDYCPNGASFFTALFSKYFLCIGNGSSQQGSPYYFAKGRRNKRKDRNDFHVHKQRYIYIPRKYALKVLKVCWKYIATVICDNNLTPYNNLFAYLSIYCD